MAEQMRAGTQAKTDLHRQAHSAFNQRDWNAVAELLAEDARFSDQARGIVAKGRAEALEWLQTWPQSFSDARVEDAVYIEAGEHSIARFIGRGTQDGPVGPFPPNGKTFEGAFCEVIRFNEAGQVVASDLYYDQLSMLIALGHIPAPEM